MKRIVIGAVAALGLVVVAFSCGGGGGGGGIGVNCTKYLKCCDATSSASSCDTAYGANSSCGVTADTQAACETGCNDGYAGIKTAALAADAGNSTACP